MQLNSVNQQTNFTSAYTRNYGRWKLYGSGNCERVSAEIVRKAFSSASKKVGLLLTDSNTGLKVGDSYVGGNLRVGHPIALTEKEAEEFCKLLTTEEKIGYLNGLLSQSFNFSSGTTIDTVDEDLFIRHIT